MGAMERDSKRRQVLKDKAILFKTGCAPQKNMATEFSLQFLNKEFLRDFFVYTCHSKNELSNPILDTLTVFLSANVQFHVSKHGLTCYNNLPPFPFTLMNSRQKHFLYEMVHSIGSEVPTHSSMALETNPLRFTIENERVVFHISPEK